MYTGMDGFTSSSSSSPDYYFNRRIRLPKGYNYLQSLGEGGFGEVVQCVKQDTGEIVAVKISRRDEDLHREANILKKLMDHKMEEFNIVKFHGAVDVKNSVGLVFEVMDITLQDYILELDGPMRLENIRTVIQQMATAFSGLKKIGVIHTDVKIDNIMMVDHKSHPFKVKLIDFGLSILKHQATPGRVFQALYYRSPEIILGLPFSEAIDIWSLGCVMGIMLFGFLLFPGHVDYDMLRFIIDLVGPPPDHLLNASQKSNRFFKKTDSDQWMLKTIHEFWGPTNYSMDNRFYTFRSLDEVKMMRLEDDNETEAEDREQCIELLKAMLTWDAKERITPEDILKHPFITRSYLRSSPYLRFYDRLRQYSSASSSKCQTQTRTDNTIKDTSDDGMDSQRDLLPADTKRRIPRDETNLRDSDVCPNCTAVLEDRTHQCNVDLPPTTSEDKKKKKKKKKKKSRISRIFSWMKRTFCCSSHNTQD